VKKEPKSGGAPTAAFCFKNGKRNEEKIGNLGKRVGLAKEGRKRLNGV